MNTCSDAAVLDSSVVFCLFEYNGLEHAAVLIFKFKCSSERKVTRTSLQHTDLLVMFC